MSASITASVLSDSLSPAGFSPTVFGVADLNQHRVALLRFAKRKIRDESLAEDAVQDTLLAAMMGLARFQGQSALRTWLFGILNHKIQDTWRREMRYVSISSDNDEDEDDRSNQIMAPADSDPAYRVSRAQFLDDLSEEVDRLPPTLRDVFMMQAVEEKPTEEVCEELQISEANCWVRLHRARKRLGDRLQAHM